MKKIELENFYGCSLTNKTCVCFCMKGAQIDLNH
jgi:hypothetical protein